MGSSQSIFYPDNPHRHDRAAQLGTDCQDFENEYNTKKAALEALLGPYKPKIDKVMAAFGCQDLDDLSRLVEQTGTTEAINQWNSVKNSYDKTQMVDQVIFGAMGIVAVAGLTISAVGAIAGGFGFFVGIAVTGDILLALGVIGLIFDAISGAIIRDKLRDAINSLFTSRLKLKHVLSHLDNLFVWMPIIQTVYAVFEEAGYSQENIIAHLKQKHMDISVTSDMKDETFMKIAQDLRTFDEQRGSWVNEDPNWQDLANNLQVTEDGASAILKGASATISILRHANTPMATTTVRPTMFAVSNVATVTTSSDTSVKVKFSSSDEHNIVPTALSGTLVLSLVKLLNTFTAIVLVKSEDKTPVGVAQGKLCHGHPTSGLDSEYWFISFANQEEAARFENPKTTPGGVKDAKVILYTRDHRYLRSDGTLSQLNSGAIKLLANYA